VTLPLQMTKVAFRYPGEQVLFSGVDLDVRPGEIVALVGPNGCGKSTLLKLILGELLPAAGTIHVLGKSPLVGRRRIGFVPQRPAFSHSFPISVREMVQMGSLSERWSMGGYSQDAVAKATEAIKSMDLDGDQSLHKLSGGQLQRAMIARALMTEPELLGMRSQTPILFVSHDLSFVKKTADRFAFLSGSLYHCESTKELWEKMTGDA
jgi:zinc transport system ATP-binding protein